MLIERKRTNKRATKSVFGKLAYGDWFAILGPNDNVSSAVFQKSEYNANRDVKCSIHFTSDFKTYVINHNGDKIVYPVTVEIIDNKIVWDYIYE